MPKKFYNFDTRFISLRDALREYLHTNNIYYELSGAYSFYHFEIFADLMQLSDINNWLDTVTIPEAAY